MKLKINLNLILKLFFSIPKYKYFFKNNSSWTDYNMNNESPLSVKLKYKKSLSNTKFKIKDYNEDIYPLY